MEARISPNSREGEFNGEGRGSVCTNQVDLVIKDVISHKQAGGWSQINRLRKPDVGKVVFHDMKT